MVSARTGGLAIALGLGCAVAMGTGVASADPADGSGGADSASSASTSASTSTSSQSDSSSGTGPSASKPSDPPTSSVSAQTSTKDATKDATKDSPTKDATKDPSTKDASTTDPEDEKSPKPIHGRSDSRPAAKTEDVEATPAEETPKQPEIAESAITTPTPAAVTASVEKSDSTPDEPSAPADTPAEWTMAAAARRELAVDPVEPEAKAAVATAKAAPSVVAIEQVAPLEALQYVPILGPALVTPIVAVLHQIPVVGDVLHPLVGYPVQWGLPAGAPRPRDVKVISEDGTQIYVHFMPATTFNADGKALTVLDGPGLGLPGATNLDGTFLDPILADTVGMLTPGTLRRAGYNVVTWDPRGEWNSGGTLELNGAEFEGRDMSAIISWIATQPEVVLDGPGDPRLGMVGVSYGGGIQLVTAANDTRVDAIVPAITYNRLDTSLYKSNAFKSSWATPLTAVLQLLGGRINPRILPAAIYGDLTGQLQPDDLELFLQRNPAIADITVPTLLIQGTADTLFSLQEADTTAQALLLKGVPVKVIWFCGGHGVCANNLLDFRDGALLEQRTLEWLDRYVKNVSTVDTGPQFEWVDQRGQWYSSVKYPVTNGTPLVESLDAERTLPLIPYVGGSGVPFVPYALKAFNAVNVTVPPATSTTYLVGAPTLTLTYSGTGSARHVYAQLVDDTTGMVLGSLVTPIPVTLDGASHTMSIDLEPVAHTLRPGESVTLQLVSSAGLYETVLPSTGTLTVTNMQVSIPTADPAAVTVVSR